MGEKRKKKLGENHDFHFSFFPKNKNHPNEKMGKELVLIVITVSRSLFLPIFRNWNVTRITSSTSNKIKSKIIDIVVQVGWTGRLPVSWFLILLSHVKSVSERLKKASHVEYDTLLLFLTFIGNGKQLERGTTILSLKETMLSKREGGEGGWISWSKLLSLSCSMSVLFGVSTGGSPRSSNGRKRKCYMEWESILIPAF